MNYRFLNHACQPLEHGLPKSFPPIPMRFICPKLTMSTAHASSSVILPFPLLQREEDVVDGGDSDGANQARAGG
jgi:hypothetical protein